VPEDPDSEPLSRLRTGDERAFAELAEKRQGVMLSIARGYVPTSAVAEEVVHDARAGMLRGTGPFERHPSFRTWLFRILVNRANQRRCPGASASGPATPARPASESPRQAAVSRWKRRAAGEGRRSRRFLRNRRTTCAASRGMRFSSCSGASFATLAGSALANAGRQQITATPAITASQRHPRCQARPECTSSRYGPAAGGRRG